MTTVLLVRHGRTAQTGPILSGWTPGLHLDEQGREQVASLAARLKAVPLAAVVTSPLERCRETAEAILEGRELELQVDERLGEVRYGDWTGQSLKALARLPLWRAVQVHPSSVTFPGGEALRDVQARAVDAIRDWNARLGDSATYLVCSHGDPIKAVIADALGAHLDLFQRISVDTASLTVIRYEHLRPQVTRVNDRGGGMGDLLPARRGRRRGRSPDAPVGGGSGQSV